MFQGAGRDAWAAQECRLDEAPGSKITGLELFLRSATGIWDDKRYVTCRRRWIGRVWWSGGANQRRRVASSPPSRFANPIISQAPFLALLLRSSLARVRARESPVCRRRPPACGAAAATVARWIPQGAAATRHDGRRPCCPLRRAAGRAASCGLRAIRLGANRKAATLLSLLALNPSWKLPWRSQPFPRWPPGLQHRPAPPRAPKASPLSLCLPLPLLSVASQSPSSPVPALEAHRRTRTPPPPTSPPDPRRCPRHLSLVLAVHPGSVLPERSTSHALLNTSKSPSSLLLLLPNPSSSVARTLVASTPKSLDTRHDRTKPARAQRGPQSDRGTPPTRLRSCLTPLRCRDGRHAIQRTKRLSRLYLHLTPGGL